MLPELTDQVGRASAMLHATSIHEQLRTVGRLLELSERCDPVECGVPLCEECASGVLRELQRRLEEADEEREMLQSAFAELEAGEEDGDDDSESEIGNDAGFEALLAKQQREVSELRAALAAAKREKEALAEEANRLRHLRDDQMREEEAKHAAINRYQLEEQEKADEVMRTAQLAVRHNPLLLSRCPRPVVSYA